MNRTETNKRKAEIAKYLAQGLKYSEICKILGISKQLVRYYKIKLSIKK